MLQFLEAPATAATVQDMWRATDFEALRSREKDKDGEKAGFFRSGKTDSWRDEVPPEAIESLMQSVTPTMKRLGYILTD